MLLILKTELLGKEGSVYREPLILDPIYLTECAALLVNAKSTLEYERSTYAKLGNGRRGRKCGSYRGPEDI